jgi:hypothetical protein
MKQGLLLRDSGFSCSVEEVRLEVGRVSTSRGGVLGSLLSGPLARFATPSF